MGLQGPQVSAAASLCTLLADLPLHRLILRASTGSVIGTAEGRPETPSRVDWERKVLLHGSPAPGGIYCCLLGPAINLDPVESLPTCSRPTKDTTAKVCARLTSPGHALHLPVISHGLQL
jgi:hypothetical protein